MAEEQYLMNYIVHSLSQGSIKQINLNHYRVLKLNHIISK